MQIKTTKPLAIVSKSITTTLASVTRDVGQLPEQLYADFGKHGIEPAGPMIFMYSGVDGNPATRIELEVALPITAKDAANYSGEFRKTEAAPFSYVDTLYSGTVADMGPKGYEPFLQKIAQQGLITGDTCREVYENWEGPESQDNKIRLQIGVGQ